MQWTRVFASDKIVKSIVNFISALLIFLQKKVDHTMMLMMMVLTVKFAQQNEKQSQLYHCVGRVLFKLGDVYRIFVRNAKTIRKKSKSKFTNVAYLLLKRSI